MKKEFFLSPTKFCGESVTNSVEVFIAGITILGRIDRTIKKVPQMPLKVKSRRNAIPQAYELTYLLSSLGSLFDTEA